MSGTEIAQPKLSKLSGLFQRLESQKFHKIKWLEFQRLESQEKLHKVKKD